MKKYQTQGQQNNGSLEQLALQAELSLPQLYQAPSQRFADVAPIHNAQYASQFTPNLTYSPYISKYLGDTNQMEMGIMRLDDLNKQAYDEIAPKLKVEDALQADYTYRDKLNQKYQGEIEKIAKDTTLNDRQRLQKLKNIRQDYENDEQRRSINSNLATRTAYAKELKDKLDKKIIDSDKYNYLLGITDSNYKGIGDAPDEAGSYQGYGTIAAATNVDIDARVNNVISGWKADTEAGGFSVDYVDGLYIKTNKQTKERTTVSPEELKAIVRQRLEDDTETMAFLKQQAMIDAYQSGQDTTNPEVLNAYLQRRIERASDFGGRKGGFSDSKSYSETGIKGNDTARWQIDRAERQAKENAEKNPNVVPSRLPPTNRPKKSTTLDKNNPEWQKARDEWVKKNENSKEAKEIEQDIRNNNGAFGMNEQSIQRKVRDRLAEKYEKEFSTDNPAKFVSELAKKDELLSRILLEEKQKAQGESAGGILAFANNEQVPISDDEIARRAYERRNTIENNQGLGFGKAENLPTAKDSEDVIKKLETGEFDALSINNEPFGRWLEKNYSNITILDKKTGKTRPAASAAEIRSSGVITGVNLNKYRGAYEIITNGEYGSNVFEFPMEESRRAENQIYIDANKTTLDGKSRPSAIQIGNAKTPVVILPSIQQTQYGEQVVPVVKFQGYLLTSKQGAEKFAQMHRLINPNVSMEQLSQYYNDAKNLGGIPMEHIELLNNKYQTTRGNFSPNLDGQGDRKATYDFNPSN